VTICATETKWCATVFCCTWCGVRHKGPDDQRCKCPGNRDLLATIVKSPLRYDCRKISVGGLMKCMCQGLVAAVSFVFLALFCIRSHHLFPVQTPKPLRCGKLLLFVCFCSSFLLELFIELSRFAVCEAIAEEMMAAVGKLAGAQSHWLALKAPAPELAWPVVHSLLQQQRVLTHVQTPIQNEFQDTSIGSGHMSQRQYEELQMHRSLSEMTSNKTDRSLGGKFGTRVFVSTLPKTKSEVSLNIQAMRTMSLLR
jgi:hypothetical protein